MREGQSGHTAQHIGLTAIRKQCQLILYTQGFCQIEIVTAVFSIYTVKPWCKLCTMICEKGAGAGGSQSEGLKGVKKKKKKGKNRKEKKTMRECIEVVMRCDRCEMYYNPSVVDCQPQ